MNGSPNALPTSTIAEIETLTNQIVRLELGLMKLNTQFQLAWSNQSKWKTWRVFAYKMAGSSMTNAGMILIAASRFRYANDPSKAPIPFLISGHIINVAAASCVVAGTLTETLLDRVMERRLKAQAKDPKSCLASFWDNREKLDKLIRERDELIASSPSLNLTQSNLVKAEGEILKDVRELVSWEFAYAYCQIRELRGVRDAATLTALVGASTAGYLGSLNALLSVANRAPTQVGTAGIGFITSGSSVVVAPLVNILGGKLANKQARATLDANNISTSEFIADKFAQDRLRCEQALAAMASDSDAQAMRALTTRASVYALHQNIFDARKQAKHLDSGISKRELKERMFFSSVVGGCNIARGIQLALAGFRYSNSPSTAFKLVASASTGYIVGSGFWTLDNIQGQIREERIKQKLAKAKPEAESALEKQLHDLEIMEDQMSIY